MQVTEQKNQDANDAIQSLTNELNSERTRRTKLEMMIVGLILFFLLPNHDPYGRILFNRMVTIQTAIQAKGDDLVTQDQFSLEQMEKNLKV